MAGSRRKDRRLAHSPGPLNRPVVRDRRRRPCRKLDGGDERRDREVIETLPDHPEGSVWFALHQSPAGGQLEPMEPRNAERKSCAGRKSDSKARLTGNPIISPPSTATALSHGCTRRTRQLRRYATGARLWQQPNNQRLGHSGRRVWHDVLPSPVTLRNLVIEKLRCLRGAPVHVLIVSAGWSPPRANSAASQGSSKAGDVVVPRAAAQCLWRSRAS
jgi:hypothetical protein